MLKRSLKRRLIVVALFLLALIGLNAIPSRPKQQTVDENAQVANGPCTVQNWGWPVAMYSHYGGGGYISPLELLVSEATPIVSQWHIVGLMMDLLIVVGGVVVLLVIRLPGLPGEGQEDVQIIRDSDREDDSNLL